MGREEITFLKNDNFQITGKFWYKLMAIKLVKCSILNPFDKLVLLGAGGGLYSSEKASHPAAPGLNQGVSQFFPDNFYSIFYWNIRHCSVN